MRRYDRKKRYKGPLSSMVVGKPIKVCESESRSREVPARACCNIVIQGTCEVAVDSSDLSIEMGGPVFSKKEEDVS